MSTALKDLRQNYQAARDCAQRTRAGTFTYLAIFLFLALLTPLLDEHPLLLSLIGLVIAAATVVRAACAFLFDRCYRRNPALWYKALLASNACLALAWSILSSMSIYFYGWQWTTMLTLLSAAAFSAGVVTIFCIDLVLAFSYLAAMLLPTLLWMALMSTRESLTSLLLFTTYLVFLLQTAYRLHKEYWTAFNNAGLLEKRARELELKNAELESFAYSVSHDLRSPLRALDGYSKVLMDEAAEKLTPEHQQYFDRIRRAAQQMGRIIDDLLKLSRISRTALNPVPVNLSALVKTNADRLAQHEPGRKVIVEIEPDVITNADESLMDLAIQNLLSNAWKYSQNSPNAKIRFARTEIDGQPAFYIKDNGVGFDVAQSHFLFKPFHRLHSQDEFPGTGIGLATVKRVLQRHGGRVWANAKMGKGATFYFSFGSAPEGEPLA